MWHLIKYRGKALITNRSMIFWTLLFPIIMATLFSLTMRNVSEGYKMETILLGVVQNQTGDEALDTMLQQLEDADILDVQYVEESQAQDLLKENDIDGYIKAGEPISLYVNQSGMPQTMLETIFTEYEQKKSQVMQMMEAGASSQTIAASLQQQYDVTEDAANENSDITSTYFFALMAMTMLYGGYWSMRTSDMQMADHSPLGARNAMSPISKSRQLRADFLLSYICIVLEQLIVLFYICVVMRIDFGNQLFAIFLVILIGSLAGNGLGLLVTSYGVKSFDGNTGVLTAIVMVFCMLAGLMFVQLKYVIQTYVPLLGYINPANMITDAFYAQYYYGIGERFYMNIASLLVFGAICYGLAFIRLRRKDYASL